MSRRNFGLGLTIVTSFWASALACSPSQKPGPSGGAAATGGAGALGGSVSVGGAIAPVGGAGASGGTLSESSGGAPSSDGGSLSTGGAPLGSGGGGLAGETSSTGGTLAAIGGSAAATRFSCPEGSSALTPTLGAATKLADPPEIPTDIPGSNFFLEGPTYYNGKVYISQFRDYSEPDLPAPGRIVAFDLLTSTYSEVATDVGTNGLAVAGTDLIYGVSQKVGGLLNIDLRTSPATVTTLVAEYMGTRLNSPNDLAVGVDGTVYLTDPDWNIQGVPPQSVNRVYRYPSTGTRALIEIPIGAPERHKPNGIALSPAGTTLYVGGNTPLADGTSTLVSLPVMADGSVGAPTNFGQITAATDGLAVDCAGNVYVVEGGSGTIQVLTPAGAPLGSITATSETSNVAFGGPEGTTLFITTLRSGLYSLDVGIPGLPY
jgi:gluconolactonase